MNVRLQYVKQRYSIFHYSNETLYSNYIFDNRYYIEKQQLLSLPRKRLLRLLFIHMGQTFAQWNDLERCVFYLLNIL